MSVSASPADVASVLNWVSMLCQMGTATIAVTIAIVTFRYTKRQNALTLINHNNALANTVNSTVIASAEARAVLIGLKDPIVGFPDDAVLFMYLNYVHNTYRMRQIGAVGTQVWHDTLAACVNTLMGLRREQVELLLARGYETGFQSDVLRLFDEVRLGPKTLVHLARRPHWRRELRAA